MSEDRFLRLEQGSRGGVARLRIHLPPVNVFGVSDLERFAERVAEARESRVLHISGLSRAFSAGVEVADHVPEPARIDAMLAAMRSVLRALVDTPAITVAEVRGACLGGGAEIASVCDFLFAAEDARIGFPEIRLACFPPGASVLLPIRIGQTRAAEWILTGRIVSGREAAQAGFATRCLLPSALQMETERVVNGLLSESAEALAGARQMLRRARREAVYDALPVAEEAYRKLAGNESLSRAVEEFRRGRHR